MQRYSLADGHVDWAREDGYLRVVEAGNPQTPEEMAQYFAAMERARIAMRLDAVLITAQASGPSPTSPHWKAIREARWKALAETTARRIAVLVDEELAVTRVQMTALSVRAPVRAFTSEADAVRWLRGAT